MSKSPIKPHSFITLIHSSCAVFGCLVLSIAFMLSTAAHAGEETEERWYQIEMLVFATDSEIGRNSESWRDRTQLDFTYPSSTVAIETDANKGLPYVPTEDLADEPAIPSFEANFNGQANEETSGSDQLAIPPFQQLQPEQWQFNSYLKSLDRRSGYRILFHSAWRQPLEEKKDAAPILVQGGRQYNEYHELEGYVRISVSRYLHIDTNLWLIDYAEAIDAADLPWNQASDRFNTLLEDETYSQAIPLGGSLEDTPSFVLEQAPATYEPIHIVEFKQSRRMRSGELHYIDHPLMGILIRLTPYELEEISTSESVGNDLARR